MQERIAELAAWLIDVLYALIDRLAPIAYPNGVIEVDPDVFGEDDYTKVEAA